MYLPRFHWFKVSLILLLTIYIGSVNPHSKEVVFLYSFLSLGTVTLVSVILERKNTAQFLRKVTRPILELQSSNWSVAKGSQGLRLMISALLFATSTSARSLGVSSPVTIVPAVASLVCILTILFSPKPELDSRYRHEPFLESYFEYLLLNIDYGKKYYAGIAVGLVLSLVIPSSLAVWTNQVLVALFSISLPLVLTHHISLFVQLRGE